MAENSTDLFRPIVDACKLHQQFIEVAKSPGHKGCRRLLNELFDEMCSTDENFIEQFQTQGFEARIFELGIFAFLKENNLVISQNNKGPDFQTSKDGNLVFVEATTCNPPDHLRLKNIHFSTKRLSEEELSSKILNELPIRYGSSLFSKLNRRYWELPECQNRAIVFAIQACHEPLVSQFPVMPLFSYIYGIRSFPNWTEGGEKLEVIKNHKHNDKIIPPNFFGQDNTDNISGVLFSNQMTVNKFVRMAYQKGYNQNSIKIHRTGFFLDKNTPTPRPYSYTLGQKGSTQETWSQGLSLMLNPFAKNHIPRSYFGKTATHIANEKEIVSSIFDFYPMNSQNLIQVFEK